jgi:mannose-1-phosphate guanylyltransferase
MSGNVVALVLAGGHGKRLWPLSTPGNPKPFRSIFDDEPPVRRVLRQAEALVGEPSDVWLAIGESQFDAARAAIPELDRYTVVSEAHATETTVTIARAALALARERPDAVLGVLSADQRLGPDDALVTALNRAVDVARSGPYLVSLGVRPDRPATAYGYMQLGDRMAVSSAFEGDGYVEKPDLETATRFVAAGRSIWNVGVFAFLVSTLLAALRRHVPDVIEALARDRAPDRPVRAIDYELMERVAPGDSERHAYLVADCSFDDLGNLSALADRASPDPRGNRRRGDVVVEGCDGCAMLAEPPRRLRVTGLEGAIVAASAEGNVLVSALGSDAPTRVRLLTQGLGCFAEVRTRGVDAEVQVDGHEVRVFAPGAGRAAGPVGIELCRCANEEEVATAAADLVADTLRSAIGRRGRAVWIPSTGRTVVGCYELLVRNHTRRVDWGRVEVFQMDELADCPADRTARHFLMHHLIEPLGIRRHTLMRDASSGAAAGVERALLAAEPDLVLHGIGENGHLGLNEPGSRFDCGTRSVALSEETRQAKGAWVSRGCTLGLGVLLAVPRGILMATGAHKRRALRAALYGPATPEVPASGLQRQGVTTVIADGAAFD